MSDSFDHSAHSFPSRGLRLVAFNVIFAGVYILAGKFGLSLAIVNLSASAVWPATGIALVAFLLYGYGIWPGIFVGAFIVNLTTAGTIPTSLAIAAGNTLERVIGAYLVG